MQMCRAMLNLMCVELVPAVRCLQNVPRHRLPEARLVFLGTCDRGFIAPASSKASIFDPAFEFLIPSIRANAICSR
jgi:hypothetical protein